MRLETCWLISCLRSLHRGAACPSPPATLNWEIIVTFAEAEGVAPALGFALATGSLQAVPASVKERLTRCLTESTARHLLMSRELGRALRQFEAEDVPVIPLRGPVLAETLYVRPALRPFSDLDLLIRPDDLLRVDEMLQTLGYRRWADDHSWSFDIAYDRATLYEGPAGLRLDLHWGLVNDPRYVWNDREGLTVWDRAVKVAVAGETAYGLCAEDLLLYLAVHLAVHHSLAGLVWYWDLAQILDRWGGTLDWETVIARAACWRVQHALFFALLGLEICFGVSGPPSVMARLQPKGPRAAVMGWLLRHREPDRLARLEHLIPLLLVDRVKDLLGPLSHSLCPRAAWVRARYGGAASSLPRQYLAHYRRMGEVMREATGGLAR